MRLAAFFRSLGATLLHGRETAKELDEELNSHVQLRADDLEASGMSRAEAERRARIESGAARNTRSKATRREAAILSKRFFRMCASAFARCAGLPDL